VTWDGWTGWAIVAVAWLVAFVLFAEVWRRR
jgi:hypothetical protein